MDKKEIILNVIGWLGAGCVLAAYFLVTIKKWKADSLWFQWTNVMGGILLAIMTFYKEAYPSTFLNVVWALIGIVAIVSLSLRKNPRNENGK
ncbi:MAG: hypothetical protein SGI71_07145 [Verrucomicrobiota bacterium]|nr:hypothetical protein [Verrucomicrobiota bacterium]